MSVPAPAVAQEVAEQKPAAESRAAAPLNLNTATAVELESLPGIGAQTAARIVEYRQKNGAFKKVEDLMNVKGIGEKSFLKLKPLVTVASKSERPAH
jgi:competence protein ComEA